MSYTHKRKKSKDPRTIVLTISIFLLAGVILFTSSCGIGSKYDASDYETDAERAVAKYAYRNGYDFEDYPEELIELYERNPETKDFVFSYPEEHDEDHEIDLSEYESTDTIPLFLQWDKRWGYEDYGTSIVAISGCGPTCLSMVSVYLLKDSSLDPLSLSNFSAGSGYYVEGRGTSWELMTDGAAALGLDVTEIPLDEERMISNLEVGNPIICCMGPGNFTTEGHFIVLTGYEDGEFTVNDPNSISRSKRTWSYEEFSDEIRNIWVYR